MSDRCSLHPVSSAAGSDAQPDRAPRSRPGSLGAGTRCRPCPVPRDVRSGCAGAGSGPRRGAGAVGGGARRGQPGAGGEPVPGVLGSAARIASRSPEPAAPLRSSRGPAGTGRVGSSAGLGACQARRGWTAGAGAEAARRWRRGAAGARRGAVPPGPGAWPRRRRGASPRCPTTAAAAPFPRGTSRTPSACTARTAASSCASTPTGRWTASARRATRTVSYPGSTAGGTGAGGRLLARAAGLREGPRLGRPALPKLRQRAVLGKRPSVCRMFLRE